jgi:hypothetical protein
MSKKALKMNKKCVFNATVFKKIHSKISLIIKL